MVAFCTDIPEFQDGRILDADYASGFPGAAVIPVFAEAMKRRGWDVVTGDHILRTRPRIPIAMDEVFIVQEEDSAIGRELIAAGAVPALIINGESPLYSHGFYRNVSRVCDVFPHRVLFSGAHGSAGTTGANHPLYFPAFHAHQKQQHVPWTERRHLAIVAGNKYWRHTDMPWLSRVRRRLHELRERDHTAWLRANQLHDSRLVLMEHFNTHGKIDVYGSGWDHIGHLPSRHRESLATLRPLNIPPGHQAKQELLSRHRFTLAMENFVYPGYVTEKILDSLVAGSIPVYLGAPDIESFIPKEAFIDIRDFPDPNDLRAFLDELDEDTAATMITAGRHFLESASGQRHSFENRGEFFAKLVSEMASSHFQKQMGPNY